MPTAREIVDAEARELVRRRGIDPEADPASVRSIVSAVLTEYQDRAVTANLPPLGDVEATFRAVSTPCPAYGPLQPFLDDPTVEEIWINEPGRVFVARRGRSELTTVILTDSEVAELVERMLRPSGRRIDLSTPFVDAMLPDGSGCTSSSRTSPGGTWP